MVDRLGPAADGGYRNPHVTLDKLTVVIGIRFSDTEAASIRLAARLAGISSSEFLRKHLIGALKADL